MEENIKSNNIPVKIFACGDIFIQKPGKNCVTDDFKKIIQSCNIAVCNFEGPIKSGGNKIFKMGVHLEQSEKAAAILREAGFNLFSLANNHIFDFGEKGLNKTLYEIKKTGSEYIGAGSDFSAAYELKIYNINSLRIGFLSFSEYQFGALDDNNSPGGYAWINHSSVTRIVRESKLKVDCLITIVHAGVECVLLPLLEWRMIYKELCNCGADIIIGHHPHVPQGFERYKKSLIFYSLGNFYFDHFLFKNKYNVSYSVVLEISKEASSFKIIWHREKGESTSIIEKEECGDYLKKINSLLGDRYEDLIDKQSIYLYETRYKKFNDFGFKNGAVNLIKSFLLPEKHLFNKQMMYLHNSAIESHRYVTMRAIRLAQDKKIRTGYSEITALIKDYNALCRRLTDINGEGVF